MNNYLKNKIQKLINETLEDKANEVMEKLKFNKHGSSFDYVEEGEMCESCGGEMSEGECTECGNMYEGEMCESCGGEMTEGECMECGGEMREQGPKRDWGSVGRGAATGGLYGAATGAAIGSVVPVVGTAVGAAVGTVYGAVTGAAAGFVLSSGGSYDGVKKIFDACNKSGMGKSTMNGGTLDSISKKLYDAVRVWIGTDEDAIKDALSQLKTIPDFCSVIKRYEENYPGKTLLDDLDGDIDTDSEWNEYVYLPLLAAKRKSEELGKKSGGEMRENDEMDFETPMRDGIRSHKGKFKTPMRNAIRSNKGKFKTPMRDAMGMRSRKNRHNDVEDDMNEGVYHEMREQDDAESRNTHNRTKDDEIIHNWLDNGKHTLKGKRDGEKFNAHSYETDSTDDKTKEWYQGHYDKIKGISHEYESDDDSFFLPGFGEISTYASDEGELDEKFYGNQRRLDKNKNGRLDSQDFKMLRKKEDVNENVFYELTTAVNGKREKLLFNESQFEEMIENIVLKEESKFNKGKTPAGYAEYERSIKTSKKNEEGYMKDLSKKMKDYLKDGSKGKYEMSPKHFPKGNGELEEMSKKAYVASGAIEDYIDNFTAAGLENLDYDEIHPDEDWVTDNVVGSSRTGNNPEWANAVETPNNEKRNKIRKDNLLAKIKRKAYNKSPQPIFTDKSGENKGDKIMTKLESIDEKKKQKINEDFTRIMDLMSYKKNTQ